MNKKEIMLKDRISEEFPDIKIRSIKSVTTGWCNDVIIVNEKIIFRFPKDKDAEDRLLLESSVLDYFRDKVNVDIPNYTYMPLSKKFAGYNMIEGGALTKQFVGKLSKQERASLIDSLADFISEVHSTKKANVKHLRIPFDNGEIISKETARKVKKRVFPLLTKKETADIEKFIPIMLKSMAEMKGYGYTHNDLRGNHMFFNKKSRRLGVIDFGDFAWFDKAKDFSELIALGADFAEEVFEKYSCKKDKDTMERAKLIYKRLGLVLMYESLEGYPMSFHEAHSFFRERFYG